jgi:hypothetical protein
MEAVYTFSLLTIKGPETDSGLDMHQSAATIAEKFLKIYSPKVAQILEIGSRDVNGTLRQFMPVGASWMGVDIEPGPGVDKIVSPGQPLPFPNESFDLVIASSVFEHDLAWWETLSEISRVLKNRASST